LIEKPAKLSRVAHLGSLNRPETCWWITQRLIPER
jgi:hypothetical protein